jgi:hypothetical protein
VQKTEYFNVKAGGAHSYHWVLQQLILQNTSTMYFQIYSLNYFENEKLVLMYVPSENTEQLLSLMVPFNSYAPLSASSQNTTG